MVRMPSEYQEVEYIESTGTQWIDTGYIPVLSPILRMRIRVTSLVDKDIAGFVSNVYPSFIIDAAPAQSRWYNRYGDTAAYGVNPRPVVGQIQEWEWGKEVKFNGNLVRTNAECDWNSNTQKMNIFSGRNNGFVAIYSCTLYDGELVRNFIPCYRKSDNEIGMYDTVTGTFFTNQGTGTFLKGNNVNYDTVNLMESRRRILLNTPHLESLTGSALSFKTDMASKLKECKIHFTPVQEGTGDPSPDNVRPIHGWDGVTVTRCGKNLFSGEIYQEGYGINDSGEITENSVYDVYRQFLKPGTYTVIWGDSNTSANKSLRVASYDANETVIDIAEYSYKTATNRILVFNVSNQATTTLLSIRSSVVNCRIVKGETDNTVPYEPYTAQSLTIPFPQTIYGGYVDLVKGEVVEEWKSFTVDGTEARYSQSSYQRFAFTVSDEGNLLYERTNPDNLLCNKLLKTAANGMGNPEYRIAIASAKALQAKITADINTPELFREWLVQNPLQVAAKLLNPTVYQLTPQTIKTLRGINNIWSDANGNIELKFWTH